MNDRREHIADLLQRTSRTFALAIPLLPEPLRHEVGVGYLLFRIADTLEDAELLGRDSRIRELGRFIELLGDPSDAAAAEAAQVWRESPVSTETEYNRLLAETGAVCAELRGLDPGAAELLKRHVVRSTLGMAETLRRADNDAAFEFGTLDELRTYCYYVAGIVGEMLTGLFHRSLKPSPARDALAADAAAFGEGLQLVNILKDAADDARDGRVYLPEAIDRRQVIAIARENLAAAERYADHLTAAGAEPGVVAFVTLPRILADATLDLIQQGEGVKVSRDVVAAKVAEALAAAGAAP
ncbi:All-trans-phytoene synthase [Botrimarina colliarenosi]|uniref:All-trans-phytoene synthase n=1 Tax=Botrimarina colliarenosi TaxID=2528001 RepID=A0A5C6ALS2_9BACT|nr:squalene/phytoene synthase family protein [Botrimarina colliarenosi]TWU00361.1 All-trans-phytoene synthase [Botrimarina colliarenosi]